MTPSGRAATHLLLECDGCARSLLDDPAAMEAALVSVGSALGARVAARVFHRFQPQGVTGFLMLDAGHISVHTWPEEGYAAADLYLHGDADAERMRAALARALGASASWAVVVDRGQGGERSASVRDHARVPVHTIDLRAPHLPPGVRVASSPGRGLGLFSTRAFAPGELVYEAPGWLVEWDADVVVHTDGGDSLHTADTYGYEVRPQLIERWPDAVRAAIVDVHELEQPTSAQLRQALTDDFERETLLLGVDGMRNHSSDPNARFDWEAMTLTFDDEEQPRFGVPVRATRAIAAGDELTSDYRDGLHDFVAAEDWLA